MKQGIRGLYRFASDRLGRPADPAAQAGPDPAAAAAPEPPPACPVHTIGADSRTDPPVPQAAPDTTSAATSADASGAGRTGPGGPGIVAGVMGPDGSIHPAGDGMTAFVATSYEACHALLKHPDVSSQCWAPILRPVMGRTIVEMDDPEHARYRQLVEGAFTRRTVERDVGEQLDALAREHVGLLVADGRGRADLVAGVAQPFPLRVIAELLGVDPGSHERLRELSDAIVSVDASPDVARAAADALAALFADVIERRRHEPGDDLVTHLLEASLDGRSLDDDEIISFMRMLFPAGVETVARSLTAMFELLLHAPDQLAAVARDRSLVPATIDEVLRLRPPFPVIPRLVADDISIGSEHIPAGSVLTVALAAANRDPARWDHPDVFDVHRRRRTNLSFAAGPHHCLGLHLARAEMSAVLQTCLDLLPGLRLDEDATARSVEGLWVDGAPSLPVRFEVGTSSAPAPVRSQPGPA